MKVKKEYYVKHLKNFYESLSELIINLKILLQFTDEENIYYGSLLNSISDFSSKTGAFQQLSSGITQLIDKVKQELGKKIIEVETLEYPGVPSELMDIEKLIEKIDLFFTANNRLNRLHQINSEYRRTENEFNKIETEIRNQIAKLLNEIVGKLQNSVSEIYSKIHKNDAVPNIVITPDPENRTLSLRTGFHDKDRIVPPAGYLSESYINTLGLALFISAVKLYNDQFPFLFLDDIVSSYDADHRLRIVDLIAESLHDFQVILTTHDHMFYRALRDRLADENWKFEKIVEWNFEHGPTMASDSTKINDIDSYVGSGDIVTAGNAVRQYMEEWFDKICEKFEVKTLHKRGFREFNRTLYDYWQPFMSRLQDLKGDFFSKRVETKPCFLRLKSHNLINYYSHYQANPYEWPSLGDIECLWVEFKEFTKLFHCDYCHSLLKYSKEDNRLYCTCGERIFIESDNVHND